MPVHTPLRTALAAAVLTLGCAAAVAAPDRATSPFTLALTPIGSYASGVFDEAGAEIVAHDARSQRLFVVNAANGLIDVLDIRDPAQPTRLFSIDLSDYGADVNSVAVSRGRIVAVVQNVVKTEPGQAVFLDSDGQVLAAVQVGSLPDMVTFTPDGRRVLVANEGEPNDDYSVDPEGTVSIIDLPGDIRRLSQADVRTAGFAAFNGAPLDASVRISGPNASVAQDVEPEYVSVSGDSRTAYVALQENNAVATLDIESGQITALRGLGFKDHLQPGNELDVGDRDGAIRIANWPVFGVPMPDAIASYQVDGSTYIVTANEGDAREYDTFADVSRLRALSGNVPLCADAPRFQAFLASNPLGVATLSDLAADVNMGRLNIVATEGLRADGSCYEALYSYGARSFSIYNADMELVFDSGADFERIVADVNPAFFNSNHTENTFETRSDDKGPEPEGVVVARLFGSTYAFIGLERVGGVMVYDVSNPRAPVFVQYFNNRDFGAVPGTPEALDLGPEGLTLIDAARSPIRGVPLLVVGNEVSGTTSVFRIDRQRRDGAR